MLEIEVLNEWFSHGSGDRRYAPLLDESAQRLTVHLFSEDPDTSIGPVRSETIIERAPTLTGGADQQIPDRIRIKSAKHAVRVIGATTGSTRLQLPESLQPPPG